MIELPEELMTSRFKMRPSRATRILSLVTNFCEERTMEVGCCHSPLKRSWIMLKYHPNCDRPPDEPEPVPVAPAPLPVPVVPVPPLPGGPALADLPAPGLALAPVPVLAPGLP